MTTKRGLTTVLYALLAIGAIFVQPVFCAGPQWLLVDENQGSSFFFDKNGTTKPKAGTFRVMTRVVYTEQGKKEALSTLASPKGLEKLYESRYRYDIDCSEMESRLLEVSHLDKAGVALKTTDLSKYTEWEAIPPDARMAIVAEVVCASLTPSPQ